MNAMIELQFALFLKSMGWEELPNHNKEEIKLVFLAGMLCGASPNTNPRDDIESELRATALQLDAIRKAAEEGSDHE